VRKQPKVHLPKLVHENENDIKMQTKKYTDVDMDLDMDWDMDKDMGKDT
jgi:hypothetical protein